MLLAAALAAIDLSGLSYTFVYRARPVRLDFIQPPGWAIASSILAIILLVRRRAPSAERFAGAAVALVGTAIVAFGVHTTHGVVLLSSIIALLFLRNPGAVGASSRREVLGSWTVMATVLILVAELGALGVWAQYPFASSYPFDRPERWRLPEMALSTFYLAYWIGPQLLLFLFASWSWAPLAAWMRRKRAGTSAPHMRNLWPGRMVRRPGLTALTILFICSVILGGYAIATTPVPIGADARKFIPFLKVPIDFAYVDSLLRWNARSGYILFLYELRSITGLSPELAFSIQPVIFSFLLSSGVFLLVRSLTGEYALALLSGLFTIFSGQSVVAMLYGAYPNWLAMVELVAYLFLALRAEAKRRWRYVFLALIAQGALLVTHYWTWAAGLAILGAYTLARALSASTRLIDSLRLSLKFPLAVIVVDVILAYNFLPVAFGSDVTLRQVFTGTAKHYPELYATDLPQVASTALFYLLHPRLDALSTVRYSLGQVGAGFFNLSWFFALGALGLYALCIRGGRLATLMLAWTFVSFLGTLLIDPFLQWRLIFIYPLPILLAAGTLQLCDWLRKLLPYEVMWKATLALILLTAVNYTFAVVGHLFVLIPSLAGG